MIELNPWFWLALLATVGLYKLELLSSLLNLSRLGTTPPKGLRDERDQESWDTLREYVTAQTRSDMVQHSVELGALLVFWWAGGFAWLASQVQGWQAGPVLEGMGFIGVLWLATFLLSIPFEAWDTFGVEARFGFNKTSIRTFISDRLKSLLLAFILGAPLLAILLALFNHVPAAALYGWLIFTGFTLLMSFIAPRLLLPLFYQFHPLKDASLRQAVVDMARRLDFPVSEVSVVDGSRRSTKGNAFFTGFGKLRRIALFDTLVEKHPQHEILAVLAHEIGHWRCGHVPKQMVLSILTSGLIFALLHFALSSPGLSAAFGIATPGAAWNLVFFFIVSAPLMQVIGLAGGWLSRKYEFEADAFARDAMQDSAPLAAALKRLDRDHMSHPAPHPLEVALHHSHPPLAERLAALGVSN